VSWGCFQSNIHISILHQCGMSSTPMMAVRVTAIVVIMKMLRGVMGLFGVFGASRFRSVLAVRLVCCRTVRLCFCICLVLR